MGRKLFISKSFYDKFKKYKCPLNIGFWHYSPNGCCLFIDDKTQTIHHLYLRETCSLTCDGLTLQKLFNTSNTLANRNGTDRKYIDNNDCLHNTDNYDYDVDDQMFDYDSDSYINNSNIDSDVRFLDVVLQSYLSDTIQVNMDEQSILNNINEESRNILLSLNNEKTQQFWFVVCNMHVPFSYNKRSVAATVEELEIQHRLIRNIHGPLMFCSDIETLVKFIAKITNRFIHHQMPILNNMSNDRLTRKLNDNIKFISQFPALNMLNEPPNANLCYMDSRDLFDVVMIGRNSNNISSMRQIHITNDINFIDTWRRMLFNFVHEMVNIKNFNKDKIKIPSTCDIKHFLKGNNKVVIPEINCNNKSDNGNCIYLKAKRTEYRLKNSINRNMVNTIIKVDMFGNIITPPSQNKTYTLELSSDGVVCKHVLEVLVAEYGEQAVTNEFKFLCLFSNPVYEHQNDNIWEQVVRGSIDNLGNELYVKDNTAAYRERVACMQELCTGGKKRMNDLHRFCIPKRFLTLSWFHWACESLKLEVFNKE